MTHAMVGASIGLLHGALPGARDRLPGWLLPAAGAALAVLPDADVLMHRFVDYSHAFGHRGAFHSPAFFVLLAAALALLVRRATRVAFSCFVLSLLSHSTLDMMTTGGLGIAAAWPLSTERYFLPWRPIPVSPLSALAFFGEWGLRVLRVELLIGIPLLVTAVVVARRARARVAVAVREVEPPTLRDE